MPFAAPMSIGRFVQWLDVCLFILVEASRIAASVSFIVEIIYSETIILEEKSI